MSLIATFCCPKSDSQQQNLINKKLPFLICKQQFISNKLFVVLSKLMTQWSWVSMFG